MEQTNQLLQALRETSVRDRRDSAGGAALRKARIHRPTKETDIRASLNIDGRGRYNISTGIHFFDHMLEPALLITEVSTLSSRRWATLKSTSITL